MALLEDRSASFIVRVWCEPELPAREQPVWRGTIEHLPSGRRQSVASLLAIAEFIQAALDEISAVPRPFR